MAQALSWEQGEHGFLLRSDTHRVIEEEEWWTGPRLSPATHLPRASCSVREVPIHAAAVIPQSGTGCTPRLHSAPPQCAPQQQRPHASRACVRAPASRMTVYQIELNDANSHPRHSRSPCAPGCHLASGSLRHKDFSVVYEQCLPERKRKCLCGYHCSLRPTPPIQMGLVCRAFRPPHPATRQLQA